MSLFSEHHNVDVGGTVFGVLSTVYCVPAMLWNNTAAEALSWLSRCVVLCCVVLCCVVLCCVVLCFVLLCCVMFCFVLFCCAVLCFVLFCFVLLCYVLFCFVVLCYVLFCFVVLCFLCERITAPVLYHNIAGTQCTVDRTPNTVPPTSTL
jgi:hypothetical protein